MKKLLILFAFLPVIASAQFGFGAGGGTGGATDTTSLSSRIDAKVDTADILSDTQAGMGYLLYNSVDTLSRLFNDSIGINPYTLRNKKFGSKIAGKTIGGIPPVSGYGLTDGQIRIVAVEIYEKCTVTAIQYGLSVSGNFTADNYNGFKLYSITGDVFTEIAATTNSGDYWKIPSETKDTAQFVTKISVNAGVYFVMLLYNSSSQTTAPSIYYRNDAGKVFNNYNNSIYFNSFDATFTQLPSTYDVSDENPTSSNFAIYLEIIKE